MLRYVLFLGIFCAVLGLLHGYLWLRLVRDTAMSGGWRTAITVSLFLFAASLPASFFLNRVMSEPTSRIVLWPVYVWLGLMFLLIVCLATIDVAKLVLWLASFVAPPLRAAFDPARRVALARLTGGAAAIVAGGLGALAIQQAARKIAVKHVEVRLANLPQALHGTTIVQLTDVHVGSLHGRAFIEQLVASVNALSPDVVAITGDLVDGTVERLGEAVEPLSRLRARHGVFFVTGNHEYYGASDPIASVDEWVTELGRLGIRVLHNERVTIGGEGDAGYDLAGVPDWSARSHGPTHAPDLDAALAGRDPSRALVLLAHQPKAIIEAAARGVGLQISGHTHGGQIWPWRYMVKIDQPFVAGLDRLGETQIYVSRGTGTWGPPMRLAEPAEITRIVLQAHS